ncbi:hypothetical protein HN587_06340 [Candidatus Woesearchaeota archaeon]|jgi:hypothetical protein|nr:hypothetical protein [Candidatus Woesearchaeota archaeon]
MTDQFKRSIAFKIKINDVLNSIYTKQEGFDPNFVSFGKKQVSRVNIIGVVVSNSTEENQVSFQNLLIEDGTGRISLRSFETESKFDADVGDIVQVIGKIRDFNGERYLIPEIVKRIDPSWVQVRKNELDFFYSEFYDTSSPVPTTSPNLSTSDQTEPKVEEEIVENVVSNQTTTPENTPSPKLAEPEDKATKLINIIRSLDSGRGATYEDVLEKSDNDSTDSLIKNLMMDGEIFEISPGKYKVLE